MADSIQFRIAPTSADRLAEIPDEGMPVWDREIDTLFIGDGATAGGVQAVDVVGFVPQFKALSATAAATETVYFRPQTSGNTLMIAMGAGAGGYTKPVVLSRETRADGAPSGVAVEDGTRLSICVTCSTLLAGRVVEIRDNAEAGDLLDTFTSDTEELFTILAEYVYSADDGQWFKLMSTRALP